MSLSFRGRFGGIYPLTTFYLIVSMAADLDALLAILTDSCSSSFESFGEIVTVTLDISKAFDKVWNKSFDF